MTPSRPSSQPEATSSALPNWSELVVGGKYLRLLQKHVQALRDEDGHGNRELFLDDVFIVSLLAFHNPVLRSLRTIEDFSQTRQAQKHLTIRRICKSTLSDFHALADPRRLEPIVTSLREELSRKGVTGGSPGELETLLKRTVAVDGTFLPALADVAWAVANRNSSSQKARYRARRIVRCFWACRVWLKSSIVRSDRSTGLWNASSDTINTSSRNNSRLP